MFDRSAIMREHHVMGTYALVDRSARNRRAAATLRDKDPEAYVLKMRRMAVIAAQNRSARRLEQHREAILAFLARTPRPPWKVLAGELGVPLRALRGLRRALENEKGAR